MPVLIYGSIIREAQIIEEARQTGMTPEDYVLRLLERSAMPAIDRSPAAAAERVARFQRWVSSLPPAPHLSDEEISREAIYSRDA